MFVTYVWPFRKLPESQERKTFFWLECNYEEAVGVLHEAKLSIDDFRNYIELLHRYRKDNHASRDFGEGLSVYSRIGFLVSEDGRTVEWASPGFPISNQWNAYNPFKEVSAQHIDRLSKITSILNSHAVQVLLNSELPNSQLMPPTRICGSGLAASTSDVSDWAILPTDGLSQE